MPISVISDVTVQGVSDDSKSEENTITVAGVLTDASGRPLYGYPVSI